MNLDQTKRDIMNAMLRFRHIHIYDLHPTISRGDFTLLSILAQSDATCTVSALAAKMHLPPPAISRALRKLESAGLIARQINHLDRRNILVSITPSGRAVYDQNTTAIQQFWDEVLNRLAPEELEAMVASWNHLMDVMEDVLHSNKQKEKPQ